MTKWVTFESADEVAAAAVGFIELESKKAIESQGEFRMVLAGGTTPQACYQLLAKRDLQWPCWKLFYGDERCLDQSDAERNHQMVIKSGLAKLVSQHYVIPSELGPEKGSKSYQQIIDKNLPFDLVLLGMGEDGHTASLFPGHEWKSAIPGQWVKAVYDSPKPPPERISLTEQALQQCRQMLVLVTGESKREAVAEWQAGKLLPVSAVAGINQCQVYIERELL